MSSEDTLAIDGWNPPPPEVWDCWLDGAHTPAENMAADEALLLSAERRGRPILRCYSWDSLAVSIGYVQRASAAPAGYGMVRRPTGGGVVYHDYDFTYSVVFPAGHWLTGLDRLRSYGWLNRSVQQALVSLGIAAELADANIAGTVERATMVCFVNPTRYDLLFQGRKIAGSAQRRTAQGILHQGSLHFGGPLPFERPAMAQALQKSLSEVMAVQCVPCNPMDDAEFAQQFRQLVDEKYATAAWNEMR